MDSFFYVMIEAAALSLALSADALAAGFAYGAAKVKIPFASAAVVGLIGSAVLAVSLATGTLAAPFLPDRLERYLSFGILAVLGLVKLSGADGSKAEHDFNRDKVLSAGEATVLAAALSLDGLAAGFSAGLGDARSYIAVLFSFVFTTLAVLFGSRQGRRLSVGARHNVRFFGLILVLLALTKLF